MTYPIIPELYGIVARKLLDEIGEKSFYSGSFSFDYGSKECRFVASIVVYRSKVCLPEGDADRIDSARSHIPSGAAPPAVFFRTHCSWFSIPAATGGSVFPLLFEKLNAVLRLSDAAILE
mgnify:CR=1 FL=1